MPDYCGYLADFGKFLQTLTKMLALSSSIGCNLLLTRVESPLIFQNKNTTLLSEVGKLVKVKLCEINIQNWQQHPIGAATSWAMGKENLTRDRGDRASSARDRSEGLKLNKI
jgi:hypothetical protein